MRLEWSPLALEDRIRIFEFIAAENIHAAFRVDDAIENQTDQLTGFPESGRPGRVTGTRELIMTAYPYTLIYSIGDATVLILRVLHHAMQWPED